MLTKETLRRAVNAACDCGGGEPGDCCPACEVWHSLRLEEEQDQGRVLEQRISVLESDIRDYERSMTKANEEIRDLKGEQRALRPAIRDLALRFMDPEEVPGNEPSEDLQTIGIAADAALRDVNLKLLAVERENREKCLELAEKAFEIRELRGAVDAAAAFVAEVDEVKAVASGDSFDELRKRLAALDLPADAPRPEPEPPTLPRPILDLMAALKASLEVYDPHGLAKEIIQPTPPSELLKLQRAQAGSIREGLRAFYGGPLVEGWLRPSTLPGLVGADGAGVLVTELPPAVHPVEAAKIHAAQEAGLIPVVAGRQEVCPHCRASLKGAHPFPDRREIRFGGPESPFLRCPDCSGFWELRPLPPAAAEGGASVNVRREVVIGAEAASLAFRPCQHVMGASCLLGELGGPPGAPHCIECTRCHKRIRWPHWPEADRERYLGLGKAAEPASVVASVNDRLTNAARLLVLLDSDDGPIALEAHLAEKAGFSMASYYWRMIAVATVRWLREQVNGPEMTGAEQTAAYEKEIFEGD